jgi:hypothetical protein
MYACTHIFSFSVIFKNLSYRVITKKEMNYYKIYKIIKFYTIMKCFIKYLAHTKCLEMVENLMLPYKQNRKFPL